MRERNEVLQAGRGIAALAIVAVHANSFVPTSRVFAFGWYGVPFFFVLSGYVIFLSAAAKPFDGARYAQARAARVYLPYLPIGIAAAVGYILLGRHVDWLASVTLLPGQPALIPAWTLQHEIAFYAIAGCFFALRIPLGGAAIWAILIALRAVEGGHYTPAEAVLLAPINGCFIAGMLLAKVRAAPSCRVPKMLLALGDASYSLYLIHLPLMGVLWRLGADFWVLIVSSVAAGVLYHRIIERPVLAFAARHRSPPRSSISRAIQPLHTPSQAFRRLPARH